MTTSPSAIIALPQEVVDRIAAGEVVQRPCSVVKELLENSLDAKSSNIVVHVEQGGLQKLVLTDNGCGIPREDLKLAATRFATSKLKALSDFDTLQSFGFRGEALASMSLVSRLQIVSRTNDSAVGYMQQYNNGAAVPTPPRPQARTVGTTVTVSDLFYNLPHRQKLNASDEYNRILSIVQYYSIHAAQQKVGFVCRKVVGKKKNNTVVDLNTSTCFASNDGSAAAATRRVMGHVFGSQLESNLLEIQCEQKSDEKSNDDRSFTYSVTGLVSHPSYSTNKSTTLVLFVNNRLVECSPLKRAMEDVCLQFSKNRPILYLSVTVPGTQVDVNVHPTKQQVALLYQDELIAAVANQLRNVLSSTEQTFANASVQPPVNPYAKKRKASLDQEEEKKDEQSSSAKVTATPLPQKKPKTTPAASSMVRTSKAAPAGAIEPYLVPSGSKTSKQSSQQHADDCPLKDGLDLSEPGAFAKAQQCNCPIVRTARTVARPRKVTPTHCTYKSILSLRRKVQKRQCPDLTKQLRDSIFVGQMSSQRCLVQCGADLVMWNVRTMAEQLFYQLALTRFGGMSPAKLEEPIDITRVMANALELEELLDEQDPKVTEVSETNHDLADQAATCLLEKADMLKEYFAMGFEQQDESILLTSLPILLENHEPSPGGLPFFLLRLATEVDWTEEKPCFQGVCRELGIYYAQTTSDVKHTLFPAISYLLAPGTQLVDDGAVSKMTNISSLYKVFERC